MVAVEDVRLVPYEHGEHIEPALDPAWSDLRKLRWHGAVVALRTGLVVQVDRSVSPEGYYDVVIGSAASAHTFYSAWTYLSGVEVGGEQVIASAAVDASSSGAIRATSVISVDPSRVEHHTIRAESVQRHRIGDLEVDAQGEHDQGVLPDRDDLRVDDLPAVHPLGEFGNRGGKVNDVVRSEADLRGNDACERLAKRDEAVVGPGHRDSLRKGQVAVVAGPDGGGDAAGIRSPGGPTVSGSSDTPDGDSSVRGVTEDGRP